MSKCFKLLVGSITFLANLSLTGSLFFYIWRLGNLQLALATILSIIITWLLTKTVKKTKAIIKKTKKIKENYQVRITSYGLLKLSHHLLIPLYLVVAANALIYLQSSQTTEAIQTPWQAIDSSFFIVYFVLTLLLIIIILKKSELAKTDNLTIEQGNNNIIINLFLISIHFFLTYTVAFFVYQINFGFDPFIHQSAEKILAATGTLSPQPLLYIGQYSLVVWLSKITSLSLVALDKLLVPLLTAALLPAATYFALTQGLKLKSRPALLSVLALHLLLLPFYFSVPQNLANLVALLAVLLSISFKKPTDLKSYLLLWLLGLATLFIHPFSGFPILIYLTIYTWLSQNKLALPKNLKLTGLALIILLGVLALPLALIVGSNISNNININLTSYQLPATSYQIFAYTPFYSIFHLVYLFKQNHTLILALLAALGLWRLIKRKSYLPVKSFQLLSPLILTFLIISINVSALHLVKLPIIAYELPEFSARFWQISLLFLIPLIMYGLGKIIDKFIYQGKPALAGNNLTMKQCSNEAINLNIPFIAFFLSLFITMAFYLTYPRHDAFTTGRAYATSQHDLAAVRWIEADAAGADYVVLANQAVSAAALQEFGFKKYYSQQCNNVTIEQCQNETENQIFYYPIPTTSKTYEIYLSMVYDAPSKKRLREALELTGADIAYFVINNYWLDSQRIAERAKAEFGLQYNLGLDKVYIFKLEK